MVNLKIAGQEDIHTLCGLANEIWYAHYPGIISLEQIEYMLAEFYSEAALEKQMLAGQNFYIIQNEDLNNLGYVAFSQTMDREWFMNKFYIKSDLQNAGIGAAVLKIWEEDKNPHIVRLQVNRQNYKAINFYFKNGFRIEKVANFDIGNGYTMNDFVMKKSY